MTTATVTELPRALEPTTADSFIPTEPRRASRAPARRRGCSSASELVELVRAARAGDDHAWALLVRRFDRNLRGCARSYRLSAADVDEVVQATWLSLFEMLDEIREPAAVGGWLMTVARRNALRRRQMHVREQLTDDPDLGEGRDCDGPETLALGAERREVLEGALAALPERQRRLVTVLLMQPTLDYREIGALLGMPIGSIGPIRARALARLARDMRLRAVSDLPAAQLSPPEPVAAGAGAH